MLAHASQTNTQLYREMRLLGYSPDDLVSIAQGYDLAVRAFSARFRASGKPFLSHLVGTASILARQHADTAVVCAGLVHAIYSQGHFVSRIEAGLGRTATLRRKLRRRVASLIGVVAEDYVHRYADFRWNAATMERCVDELDAIAGADRRILEIRVANELEEMFEYKYRKYTPRELELMGTLCDRLGFSGASEAIRTSHFATREAEATDAFERYCTTLPEGSYTSIPEGYSLGLIPEATLKARQGYRWVRRHLLFIG